MSHHRFPFVLLIAGLLLTHSFYAMADSSPTFDDVSGKKDPPRPKPKPGPRGGGDDDN